VGVGSRISRCALGAWSNVRFVTPCWRLMPSKSSDSSAIISPRIRRRSLISERKRFVRHGTSGDAVGRHELPRHPYSSRCPDDRRRPQVTAFGAEREKSHPTSTPSADPSRARGNAHPGGHLLADGEPSEVIGWSSASARASTNGRSRRSLPGVAQRVEDIRAVHRPL